MKLPGSMREQITINQKSGTTRDSSGAIIPTVTTIGPLFAYVEYKEVGSDEQNIAEKPTARTSVNFTIRNSPDRTISKQDEIVYRNQTFEILSVLEHGERRAYLLIEAILYE